MVSKVLAWSTQDALKVRPVGMFQMWWQHQDQAVLPSFKTVEEIVCVDSTFMIVVRRMLLWVTCVMVHAFKYPEEFEER